MTFVHFNSSGFDSTAASQITETLVTGELKKPTVCFKAIQRGEISKFVFPEVGFTSVCVILKNVSLGILHSSFIVVGSFVWALKRSLKQQTQCVSLVASVWFFQGLYRSNPQSAYKLYPITWLIKQSLEFSLVFCYIFLYFYSCATSLCLKIVWHSVSQIKPNRGLIYV